MIKKGDIFYWTGEKHKYLYTNSYNLYICYRCEYKTNTAVDEKTILEIMENQEYHKDFTKKDMDPDFIDFI